MKINTSCVSVMISLCEACHDSLKCFLIFGYLAIRILSKYLLIHISDIQILSKNSDIHISDIQIECILAFRYLFYIAPSNLPVSCVFCPEDCCAQKLMPSERFEFLVVGFTNEYISSWSLLCEVWGLRRPFWCIFYEY